MNIKDSYIHNGTAVLKDVKVENSVLKKILAGKDANDAYLGWETVCDLTGIKPKAAGTADKVGHKLTFSGGVTGTWDGSADKTVAIPTKSSWNYDDVYLKLTGNGTTNPLTGTIYIKDVNGIILNSKDKDLNIWEVYGASGTWTSQFGFNLQYLGTGSGNNNDLILWAHNQAGTHVESYRVKQDGTFIFKAVPKVGTNIMYHAGNLTASVIGGLGTLSNNISGNAATATKANSIATEQGTSNVYRNVFFAYNGDKTKVVYDDDFMYNPSTNTLKIGTGTITATTYSGTATNANNLANIAADNYFKHRDAIFNSEWSGRYLWTLWDNHLYAADKRFAVTLTGTGETNLSYLFDGSFESSVSITEAKAVLHIKHTTAGNVWTSGLPYGSFYVVFYNSDAENVAGRVYCNYDGQGIGWHDLTVTHVRPHVWELNNDYYQLSDLEITITKPASSASIQLCQVLHEVERSAGPNLAAVMSKYCNQKTNYNIEAAKFIKTGGTSAQFLKADGSVDSNTYSKSNHTHTFSEIGPGVATIGDGTNRLMFRTDPNWKSGMYYSTAGNEALVFGTANPMTSWIFATTDPTTQTTWTSLTPSLQIKHGRVVINKLIATSSDASYNLDVNGSANATTLYENGVRVSVNGHTHSYIVTQGDTRSVATVPSDYKNKITFAGLKYNSIIGNPSSTSPYSYVIGLRGWSDTSGGKAHELAFNDNGIFHRIGATDAWETWAMMLTTSNYNSYVPSLTGTGASGTWGISITGSAGSVDWGNVTGKPSSFNPSSHTHSYTTIESCTTLDTNSDNFSAEFAGGSNSVTTKPSGVDAFGVIKLKTASGWYGQILLSSNTAQGLYYRTSTSLSSSVGWQKLLDSSNYNSYAPKLDGTGATGTWKINISGNAASATKATKDGNGNVITNTYLSLSGGTMSNTNKVTNLNADLLDEYHAGVTNGSVGIFVPWPNATTLKNEGLMPSEYGTSEFGHPDNVYLQSICKWAIAHYTSLGSVTLIGAIAPNSSGTCILHLYSSSGKDSSTLLPRYCSGTYTKLSGYIYNFGTVDYNWYYRQVSAGYASSADSATTSTYASNVGSSGTAGTNYVTASKVISACNWYDTMIGSDSDTVINRWSEIVAFVAGFKETPDLATFLSNNYLAKAGGTMTGPLKWANATALPQQTSPQYFLCIDAFDDGGTTKWASKADTLKALTGLTSTAIGDSDEPVYWNGSKFVKAGAYPTKSSWNYDDKYLKLTGGTLSGDLAFSHGSSSIDQHITWSSGTNHQRLKVRDGKTDVFIFQYSTDSGATWSDYFTIQNGTAKIGSNTVYHSGNLPAYPTVNNGALYLQANGTTKVTFTANQSDNSTLNIATGSSNGTISVGGTNVSVKGLGSNAYSSTAYLPLAGGTMDTTAQIKREGRSGSWVGGRDRAIIRETSSSGYHPLFSLKTKDGSWELGEYNTSGLYNVPIFSYVTDTDYSNGNNTTTYQIKYPLASGTIALTADLKWSNISSKPETATRWPSWSEVTNKPSTFPVSEHNHDGRYLRWNGSAADVSAMAWGTLTAANGYTILSHAASSDGGDWGMVNKGGKIYMQLDGYYYQNEGQYRVTDVSETVTALGTNGNYLTWTKNGSTSNITVPYATKAGSANSATSAEYAKRLTSNSSTNIGGLSYYYIGGSTFNTTVDGSWSGYSTTTNYNSIVRVQSHTGTAKYYIDLIFDVNNSEIYYRRVTNNNLANIRKIDVYEVPESTASYSLSNAAWTNTITLPTTAGSYILNIVSGNSTLTGVFSIGASDNAKDEISLHLHGNGPRLYARTNGTTLQLSSNDASATSRSVTIKYRRMI